MTRKLAALSSAASATAAPLLANAAAAIAPAVFEQAVEQADLAISITDADANILYVNPAFSRVTGYTAEELVGCKQSLLSNRSTPPAIYDEMWATITRGLPWSGRLINRRQDGGPYLADLLITPVVDAAGEITNYLGIHRDVTLLHRLECEVAEQKALIESVVDSAPVVMALLDGNERVVLDNHEYKKLMGDLRMVEPATLIVASVRADLGDFRATAQEGGNAFADHEIRVDSPAGPRWFACSGIWVQRKDGAVDAFFSRRDELYLLLVARETTRQRTEQEKTRVALLQAMMAEESHVEDLRETLSAAVFKIEGPINVIGSVVATLERRGGGAGMVVADALAACKEAVDQLRKAIPEHAPEPPAPVNINEAMRDVLDLCTRRLLAAGVRVHWQPQAVLPSVYAYPKRVRSMFKAIIDNAIDAMNAKGWQRRELRVATRARRERVEVVVDDSGPGIPAELRLKVFEPFYSTHAAGGRHLGTGLSSAQQVAADLDGVIEIDVASAAAGDHSGDAALGGCRVRVVLPSRK